MRINPGSLLDKLTSLGYSYHDARNHARKVNVNQTFKELGYQLLSYHTATDIQSELKGRKGIKLGIELEIEYYAGSDSFDQYHVDNLYDAAYDTQLIDSIPFKTERDGSLVNGLEIVTAPRTIAEIRASYSKLYKFLKKIQEQGWRSHESGRCGLHVHIEKTKPLVATRIEKLILGEGKEFWTRFSRRSDTHYCQFIKQQNGHRYCAVNRLPKDTVELRFLRGSLSGKTFLACLDAAISIVEFCGAHSANWDNYVEYVLRNPTRYKALIAYVDQKMGSYWNSLVPLKLRDRKAWKDAIERDLQIQAIRWANSLSSVIHQPRILPGETQIMIPIRIVNPNKHDLRMSERITPIAILPNCGDYRGVQGIKTVRRGNGLAFFQLDRG